MDYLTAEFAQSAFQYIVNYANTPQGALELVASALLILNVYLLGKQNIINFIPGILGVGIFVYIFYNEKLYSDAILQVFFIVFQVIGFYQWMYGGRKGADSLEVTMLDHPSRLMTIFAIAGSTIAFGYFMLNNTDAAYPYWDASILMMSMFAQLLLNIKKWDSWLIWVTVDVAAVPLYFNKGLYVTTGLYVVFLFLALYGLIEWTKSLRNHNTNVIQAV